MATLQGTVTILAGSGIAKHGDGRGASCHFSQPSQVISDADGNLFVSDTGTHCIRCMAPDGTTTTLAGQAGKAGYQDGVRSAALFNTPRGLELSKDNLVLYVADSGNHCVRRVILGKDQDTTGDVSTVAGVREATWADGDKESARFNSPTDIALDSTGALLVADSANHRIRKVAFLEADQVTVALPSLDTDQVTAGQVNVSTVAGSGSAGLMDARGLAAAFYFPMQHQYGPWRYDFCVGERQRVHPHNYTSRRRRACCRHFLSGLC